MSNPKLIHFGNPEIPHVDKVLDPASVIDGNPAQKSWLYADEVAAGAKCGMWDCQAGTHRATMDGIIEFCCIIEGAAEVTDLDSGTVHSLKAGDAFVMQEGFRSEWHVPEYVKKYFVITQTK